MQLLLGMQHYVGQEISVTLSTNERPATWQQQKKKFDFVTC